MGPVWEVLEICEWRSGSCGVGKTEGCVWHISVHCIVVLRAQLCKTVHNHSKTDDCELHSSAMRKIVQIGVYNSAKQSKMVQNSANLCVQKLKTVKDNLDQMLDTGI